MTAITKPELLGMVRDSISQYPDASLRYQAGDQTLLASIDAMASMMAAVSQQVEIEAAEAFDKVRDATVLADASLKGILPMAVPSTVALSVQNRSSTPFALQAGRTLLDSAGNLYVVTTPVTIAPGASAQSVLQQRTVRIQNFSVTQSTPFLAIEISPSTEDRVLCGLSVRRSDGQEFSYTPDFCNVEADEFVYHVETDELRRLYVRFGYDGIVGYQPAVGDQFVIEIAECNGDVRPDVGSPFALQYTYTPQDSQIAAVMESLLESGAAPMDIATIREFSKYPSAYNDNAVYLGEFDRLVRKKVPGLRFLSVWNEQIEEAARGADIDNINRLFVAFQPADGDGVPSTQDRIAAAIKQADDGYSIRFVAMADAPIAVNIEAFVSAVNDAAAVTSQIRASVISEYGVDTPAARRGLVQPQHTRLYDRIRKNVAAVADSEADLRIVISLPTGPQLPEQRRAVTESSLTVTVTTRTQTAGNWGL